MKKWLSIIFLSFSIGRSADTGEGKPKYGPEAVLLSESHEHIQKNQAPDYWALSPYYVGQFNDKACSAASITMIVNAARSRTNLTSEDRLVTQEGLLKKVADPSWQRAVGPVPLDRLGSLVEKGLTAYGIAAAKVEVFHTTDTSQEIKRKLHRALVENERSTQDFILINFIQGIYTGDAMVGHISPVAAYDSKKKRVLVMDPDREWYEPYWISEETLLKGMATQDPQSGRTRGYVWIKLKGRPRTRPASQP